MNKKIFELSDEEATRVLSLFKGVCTDEGALPLHDIHRSTIAAIGTHIDGDALDGKFEPSADSIKDSDLQHELSYMAAVFPFDQCKSPDILDEGIAKYN